MKILVVVMGLAPESGGPTRSCKGLCRSLAQAGVDVTLYVFGARHPFENPCGVKIIYTGDIPLIDFASNLRLYDLVHLQGLWNPGFHKIAKACRKQHVPYMISPRGMLDPWALSVKKWKKRLGMLLYQRHDLKKAVAFHATADLEASHIRAQGLTQPIVIAPNGVELPEVLPEVKVKGEGEQRTAIFLSRLHPGKGLIALAEAWARVKPQGWRMLVVGPDSYGHKADVIAKLAALGIPYIDGENIHSPTPAPTPTPTPTLHSNFTSTYWEFHDQVNDVEKWQLYRASEILIHPSVSENFGITIAEGLYAGLPVIATKGTPWKDLVDYHCGWWIDQGIDALDNALREATQLTGETLHSPTPTLHSDSLSAMGENGHRLILSKYTWPAIAETMIRGYQQILTPLKPFPCDLL